MGGDALTSVVDPRHVDADHFDADPDSTYHPDADPDADLDSKFLFDADQHSNFHPDADPGLDPDPSFQIKAQTIEKVLNMLIFHTFWLVICKLMRIRFRIKLMTMMWIRIFI